jgi:hypothetical protein
MTSRLLSWPALLAALILDGAAQAQSCQWRPQGPQGPGLYDMGGRPCSSSAAQAPTPRYMSRWGAIATSDTTVKMGVSFGETSRRIAEQQAMERCGTRDCRIDFTYHDQCVAVAWGNGYSTMSSAMTLDEATAMSLQRCRAQASQCKTVYTECSLAEPVR